MNHHLHSTIEVLEARIAPAALIELSSLNGSNGFKLSGAAGLDHSGRSVSDAGDVNGDGFDDIIIGAHYAAPNGGGSGASYVVFGKAGGFAANLNLSSINGTNGFRINGVAAGDNSAESVSAAGDVNGDGFGDLIIGARGADANGANAGAAYVVFGKASGFGANLNLSTLNGTNGFKLSGAAYADAAGGSVSAAGDVNGDGFDDVIVAAEDADPNGSGSGASYVVFGKASGFAANLNLSTLNGSNGFKVSGVGFFDGSDLSVSAAGDVNGDGLGDVIIGAAIADYDRRRPGASYVVFGKTSGFAANLNLSALDGSNGFKLSGVAARDYAGFSVSGAGDVNGDGFADVVVGAFRADPNGDSSGASYVVFGKASGFTANLNLSTLNGGNGFRVSGAAAQDSSGYSVSGVGDFNGDGFDDVIIGAPNATGSARGSGASYVIFGKAGGFAADVSLSSLNGVNGFKLGGVAAYDSAGCAVSAAGDVNGDGFGDLVIGAYRADPNGNSSGASYVVFGGPLPGGLSISDAKVVEPVSGTATASFTVTLSAASTTAVSVQYSTANGTATAPGDFVAPSLSTLTFAPGETSRAIQVAINADSIRELEETFFVNLSNATNATLTDAQAIGTIFDQSAQVQLSSLDGRNGFKISGVAAGDESGMSVSDAGDVNGDGFADVIIGANGADPNGSSSGASYVVFGKASGFAANFNLSTLDGSNGFKLSGVAEGDQSGRSVSAAGDVNGDGFDDLIIGAFDVGFGRGASYVVFGKRDAFSANLNLSALTGTNGFKINGVADLDVSGGSVSSAGDVNGDGLGDLLIGASLSDTNGESSGASYVVFGARGGFFSSMNLSSLDGANGFKMSGTPFDQVGKWVSAAGDVNGDGFDDVIVGATGSQPDGRSGPGASYVVFGKASGFAAALNLTTLNGTNGFKINGVTVNDNAGSSVSGAGDINGDGFGDLLIGASSTSANGQYSGATYVVFGKAGGFSSALSLSTLTGANGFKITGEASRDFSGFPVSGAGDVNGDGYDDLLIGANGADPNGESSGASYVVFGKAAGFGATLGLSTLNGSNGFKLTGVNAGDRAGVSVSAAGDVDGDGFDDLLVGAPYADPNGTSSGASYVIFGQGVEISVSDAAVSEGNTATTALQFTVSLSQAGLIPVSVQVATLNGTALAGSDFTVLTPRTITFAPGEVSKIVTVDVTGDRRFENDESLSLVLSAATGGVIRDATGIGTIRNDDARPFVSIAGGSLVEGDAGNSLLTVVVSLSAESGLPATVQFASADGTALAGSDYTALVGTLTFAPGEIAKAITVEVRGDALFENDESFSVTLSAADGAVITDGSDVAAGTIRNDDAPPVVSITGGSLVEGDSGGRALAFTVSLSAASGLPASVQFASTDGTAVAGIDYTALVPGTLTFAPGEMTKTIIVEVLADATIEDHESFSVVLSDASGATFGTATATGTIVNDDTAVRIGSAGSLLEGDAGTRTLVFPVTLEKASALPVTVSYTTADGTATAGSDYEAVPVTQLTFAPGETTKTVAVNVLGDTEVEGHETFAVILSDARGASIAEGTAAATILNDETRLRVTDASLLEGHSGPRALTFTVSLSTASALPVSVSYSSTDGTATAGADYTAVTPGVLTFAPGETTKTLTLEALGDTRVEASETFSITLADAANAVIDDATGVGTILNDDVTLTGKRTATFKDVDGDRVTITVSKGKLKVEDFTLFPSGSGSQLALVDFRDDVKFAGADLSITAKTPRRGGGDGLAHVGFIDASGIDLGNVRVKGDLGQIDAGDERARPPGLLSFAAQSIGRLGVESQLPGGSLQSDITGGLPLLKLGGGMDGATLLVSGDLGLAKIKGDVRDSAMRSDGRIGAVKIQGNLAGTADGPATISARGVLAPGSNARALAIGSITVEGSVEGAEILAGYDRTGGAVNGEVRVGSVFVGSRWVSSSMAAGAAAGDDGLFGTGDDEPISTTGSIVAKIASIVIQRSASGSATPGDHFGFVAGEIGLLQGGRGKIALTPGAGNDLDGHAVGSTGDLRAREVA